MEACNFPEFLALDLETAESIFAAKQMTAGLPRSLGAIHGSPEVLSSDFMAQLNDAVTCSPPSDNLVRTKPCTRDPLQTAAAAMSATGQAHGRAKRPASVNSAQSDSETDSIDSFVAAAKKSASVPARRAEPQPRGHLALDPEKHPSLLSQFNRYTKPRDSVDNDAQSSNAVHGTLRNTNSRISHRTRDSYASYEGYGSLFGDYDYADDYDNYSLPSDAESVSSFGVSVPTNRDRQQSVVTAATSVSSSDRHASVQSHILSAMGPFSPVCEPRHSGQSSRSGASLGRRVEFNLDSEAIGDRSMDRNDSSASRGVKNTTTTRDSDERQRHSEEAPTRAPAVRNVRSESRADDSDRKGHGRHDSWLNFDEDGSDDDSKSKPPAFKTNPFSPNALIAGQRPRTSHGQSRGLGRDLSPGPRTGSLALRRRSSLDSGKVGTWENTSSLQQRRRLRHVVPLRDLSVLCDAASAAAPSWLDSGSVLSPKSREPDSGKQAASPICAGSSKASTAVSKTVDEVPLVLQKTVYRQPNTEHRGQQQANDQQARGVLAIDGSGNNASANQSSSPTGELRSYFDDDDEDDDDKCDDNSPGMEGSARKDRDAMGSNITSRFDDFDEIDDYGCIDTNGQTASATATLFSRNAIGSVRSARSRLSVSSTLEAGPKASFESYPVAFPGAASEGLVNAEKTSSDLQYWLRHASEQQSQQDRRLPPPRPAAGSNGFPVSQKLPLTEQDGASPALPRPFDYSSFYYPGVVGIPLPRDVVETLRVSVSCFPETMLSLSSFSIQTIRSYSRKVRRCSPSGADSTLRLLMAPGPPNGVQPGPSTATPFVPPFLPPSPTTASFRNATADPDTDLRRTRTGVSVDTTASHRFWKFPKRLGALRPSSSSNSLGSGAGNGASLSSGRPPSPHVRHLREDSNGLEPSLPDDGQGKGSGICFKRIFPTGSDYLCDALYAHIIAFNYISLLCPPVDAQPASHEPASEALPDPDARPQTSAGNTIATTSTATLIENGDKTKRQTIRIYMGSDVALQSAAVASMAQLEDAAPVENYSAMLDSPPPSPPPSRGRSDDSNRLISRKAASLLGITEMLEPDMSNSKALLKRNHHQSVGSGLARRYHTMRQRHLRTAAPSPPGEAATSKKPVGAAASKKPLEISKPLPVQPDSLPTAVPTAPEAALSTSASTPAFAPSSLPQPPLPPAAATPSDAHLRDLQAGLHHCISQLVSTLKLTTGQLGNTTLLTAETARELDPLFLRMLCELVRSQEEPI